MQIEYKKKKDSRFQKKDERPPRPNGSEEAQTKRQAQTYCMISDESLGKSEHLLKTGDFRQVYKKGAFCKRDSFVLYSLPKKTDQNRIGFSISSRAVRLANRRNRIRRLFRESYRKSRKELKQGFDIVIVGKRDPGKKIGYSEIEALFLKLAEGVRLRQP